MEVIQENKMEVIHDGPILDENKEIDMNIKGSENIDLVKDDKEIENVDEDQECEKDKEIENMNEDQKCEKEEDKGIEKERSQNFQNLVVETAEKYQKEVIEFCAKEITKIKENSKTKILIEGRSFTLDFLPSDLRIKLFADAPIRDKQRGISWTSLFKSSFL
jgi:hypothetical protein